MKVFLVSSDPNFRAPAAAMLGVRGLDVHESDDVFDAIAVARKSGGAALLALHGVDADDVATAQRGAAKATSRTLVAVLGAEAPAGAHAIAFDGRFPPLVDALVALVRSSSNEQTAPPSAVTRVVVDAPPRERVPTVEELLALSRFGSYYELLGIGPDAGEEAIAAAAAHRRAWLNARSETGGDSALIAEIDAAVTDAATVLTDTQLRRLYTAGLVAASAR